MKHSVIAIIGVGRVGATIAYTLMLRNIVAELILVDKDTKRCQGEMRDLSDALPFCTTSRIRQGNYRDARHADIIIIAAGKAQDSGQARMDLLSANKKIVDSIIDELKPLNPDTVIIVVTNPVDLMTYLVHQKAGLQEGHVIGSGTLLDTQRLRRFLSCELDVAAESIDGYVLGEHGDAQFIPWSLVRIGGKPINEYKMNTRLLEQAVKQEAYDIIAAKSATYYGIAACVATICAIILFDTHQIIPVSFYNKEYDICLSLPAVIGKQGVVDLMELSFTSNEQRKLDSCIRDMRSIAQKL